MTPGLLLVPMNSLLRSLPLFLFLLPAAIHASTTAPMFAGSLGTTLTIQGETYTWTSATEDATWHIDTYTNTTAQTVTVTGKLGASNLATVSGSSSTGTVAGYLISAVYGDNHQTSSTDGSWQFNGVTYTHRNLQQDYSVDWNYDGVSSSGSDDYTGPDGHLHNTWSSPAGGGGESHSTFTGGKIPFSTQAQFTIFGTTYNFTESSSTSNEYYDSYDGGWADKYVNLDGGNLQVGSGYGDGSDPSYTLSVWDPHLGSVMSNTVSTLPNGSLTGITWRARSAPTFAKAQLWMDGKLLNWQSGTITTAGLVTDTYSGAGVTLTIIALAHDYYADGGNAAVTITSAGGGSGTLAHGGIFNLSGHVLQNAAANHSAPLFVSGATLLKSGLTSYAFTGGFQDSLGNRTDVYSNPSYGVIVMTGAASDPAHANVNVTKSSLIGSGTYSNGVFSIFPPVTKPTSQPSIYGPPAFWVRGELYLQNATTPTSYASAAGHSLTLSGTSNWTLAGSDTTGAFSGACDHDPVGVFLVQALDGSGQPVAGALVPVIPANADGSLHLSWEAAPTGMPPGMRENDHNLVYLGTAADDTNSAATAAYYGSATASDQSRWLIKLRTDGSGTTPYTATHTDYSTATSSTGSYSAQTHLFQTASLSSGFPVPVYGVDPNANNALWGLNLPDSTSGLPATFLVQGDVWRYTGTDGSGTATYLGYYSSPETGSQIMTVAAPDASGARVVTVTDPYRGDGSATQGTLNDVRGSARLRDGSEVYSGNFSGQQVNPALNEHNLHTIAADLDITGNVITFGALTGNAATAGVTMQFQDTASDGSFTGSFYSMLARPQAQWLWARTASSSGQSTLPVMKLDATHKLTLYGSPATGQTQNAGVVLDPTPGGVSTLRGVLRVRPGGDIDMGEFMAGGEP